MQDELELLTYLLIMVWTIQKKRSNNNSQP